MVPNVVGQQQAGAQSTITAAGFVVGTVTTRHDPLPAGSVLGQTPTGGSRAPAGSPVDIVVSLGPEPLPTPSPSPSPTPVPPLPPIASPDAYAVNAGDVLARRRARRARQRRRPEPRPADDDAGARSGERQLVLRPTARRLRPARLARAGVRLLRGLPGRVGEPRPVVVVVAVHDRRRPSRARPLRQRDRASRARRTCRHTRRSRSPSSCGPTIVEGNGPIDGPDAVPCSRRRDRSDRHHVLERRAAAGVPGPYPGGDQAAFTGAADRTRRLGLLAVGELRSPRLRRSTWTPGRRSAGSRRRELGAGQRLRVHRRAAFEPVLEQQRTSFDAVSAANQIMMAPVVGDLNGDGTPDVVAVTYPATPGSRTASCVRSRCARRHRRR